MGTRTIAMTVALLLALPWAVAAQPEEQPSPPEIDHELIVVLDGSGSITDLEWTALTQAVANLLRQPALIGDGGVAVGVVAYGGYGDGNDAEVLLPSTPITSARQGESLGLDILRAEQRDGDTPTGEGLAVAARQFAHPDAAQTACLVTDGVTNVGLSTSAGAAAVHGVADHLTVQAIADRRDFDRAAAEAEYGGIVAGDGQLSFTSDAGQVVNQLSAACLGGADATVVGIEVTQAVQDLRNSYPLVAGRFATARVYGHATDADATWTVRLVGERDGAELEGSPLAPQNADLAADSDDAIMPDDPHRGDVSTSLQFDIPPDWLEPGQLTLRVEGVGAAVTCLDAAGPTEQDCETTVEVRDAEPLTMQLVRFDSVQDSSEVPVDTSYEGGLRASARAMFPFPSIRFPAAEHAPDPIDLDATPGTAGAAAMNEHLAALGLASCCDRAVFGYTTAEDGAGKAAITTGVSSAILNDGRIQAHTAMHEMAHSFGRLHTAPKLSGSGPCGSSGGGGTWPYIYDLPGILEANAAHDQRAAIGPVAGFDGSTAADEVWGWRDTAIGGGPVDPRQAAALMSYCFDGTSLRSGDLDSAANAQRWIAGPDWTGILDVWSDASIGGRVRQGITGIVTGNAPLPLGFEDAELSRLSYGETDLQMDGSTGEYQLVALDAEGDELATFAFDPPEAKEQTGDEPDVEGPEPEVIPFVLETTRIPARIELRHAEEVLTAVDASATPPTVAIETPPAEELSGEVELTWTGSDPDGDDVTYDVVWDQGSDRQPLAVGTDATSLTVDTALLHPGIGSFVVVASDGVLTAETSTESVDIARQAVTNMELLQPVDGTTVAYGQLLVLQAAASRPDQTVPPVSWESDVDGQILRGLEGTVAASTLTPGPHALTVTVGSGEQAVSQSVVIEVVAALETTTLFQRIGGQTRAGTAAALALSAYGDEPGTDVVIASGEDFPDALAAGAPAGDMGMPLLLTGRDSLPPETVEALQVLQPYSVTLVGGPAAISQAVEDELQGLGHSPWRIAGPERFATAALLAQTFGRLSPDVVYLATGRDFPDALSGSAAAAVVAGKVLLTEPTALPDATRTALAEIAPEELIILGGTAAVSSAVEAEVADLAGTVQRHAADNRIETAISVSAEFDSPELVYVATAGDFPDGLTAGAIAGASGAPILLTPSEGPVPQAVLDRLVELDPAGVVLVGGTAALSVDVEESLRAALQ